MRATNSRTCLLAILIGAVPAAAQVSDIRGLTFDVSLGLELHGNVLETHFHGIQPFTALDPLPWTFDVLPDAEAAMDPARIVIRMRLPTGADTTDPVRFELHGTYDEVTGEISASGICPGCHFWQTPFVDDAFGLLDVAAPVWVMIRNPEMTLNAVVSTAAEEDAACLLGFDILGGQAVAAQTVAADIALNASLIAWVPAGSADPAQASFGPYAYTEVTAELTALVAHVREVFGDMNDDALLTQADIIEIHKMFGPVTGGRAEGDLTADGIVDAQDADLLKWLVRCIGNKDVVSGGLPGLQGTASKTAGKKPSSLP